MTFYFNAKSHKGRQGNFCTTASVLSDEYKAACNNSIKTRSEYEALISLAYRRAREQWKEIVQAVTQKFCT